MTIFYWIILISWLVFIGYWAVAAIGAKKDVTKSIWWSGWIYAVRLAIALVVILIAIFHFSSISRVFVARFNTMGSTATEIGAVLCALGIVFAIWARFHLGKNWSSHPTLKENHELVTSGPYRFVRHPIYTGMLLAMVGTGLTVGYIWLIPLVIGVMVFVRRISVEEQMMTEQFPDTYPEYKKRTKALIPFVW
ncbi:MAG: isoprenylcysteine carboxylmethyltransferase family protein [Candidatus Paceibacterota bacterium]|jgi:protein-S-isoprenylcysteine O-methyltransferase Ste14